MRNEQTGVPGAMDVVGEFRDSRISFETIYLSAAQKIFCNADRFKKIPGGVNEGRYVDTGQSPTMFQDHLCDGLSLSSLRLG